jgi:hypothetical protein
MWIRTDRFGWDWTLPARVKSESVRNRFLPPASIRELATRLLLARIDSILRERKDYRDALPDFSSKWALLKVANEEKLTIESDGSLSGANAFMN